MKRSPISLSVLVVAGSSLALFSACSKNEDSAQATPTPSPVVATTATTTPLAAASPGSSAAPLANLESQAREAEAQMDSIFSKAFHDLGGEFGQSSISSTMNLREDKDKYVARFYLPNAENANVQANVTNGELHITARTQQKANNTAEKSNLEEVMTLPKPVLADKIAIDRKQNMVTISIPKSTPSAPALASANTPAPSASPAASSSSDWEASMKDQFARLETGMDDAFRRFFPKDLSADATGSQLGSAVKVDNQNDSYVVHFYLPKRDLANAKVTLSNGQLNLVATDNKTANNQSASGTEETSSSGRYEEMIALPGPVKEAEMKVERKGDSVDVTLPKA